ncbi:MAG: uroporphyrinogen-III synthase [Actinomycetota bacterium]|nr:uroporphyrinogen-III synthase [Actinomycetota bacterium]
MKILLTRPEGRNEELAEALRAAGHEVVCEPLIEVEPLGDDPIELEGYDWVLVTSVTGARELRRRARGGAKRVAAIGRATADAFGGADLIPRVSTQEGLLAEIPRPAGRVLFVGAETARRLLVDELEADFVALYRTLELCPESLPGTDLVVLASPSAARAFARLARDTPALSIGPETTAAAEKLGIRVVREATTHDLDGLISAVAEATR